MIAAVNPAENTVQALCLTPTRELATQIFVDALVPMSQRKGVRVELLVPLDGGATRQGTSQAHVVVGTPGHIKTLIERNYLRNLQKTVKIFVCDEADEMVQEGDLRTQTVTIRKKLNPTVQTVLFSATYPEKVQEMGKLLINGTASFITLRSNHKLVLNTIFQV